MYDSLGCKGVLKLAPEGWLYKNMTIGGYPRPEGYEKGSKYKQLD